LLLLVASSSTSAEQTEPQCLAEAIYHEARAEPLHGQLAVAQVLLNRTKLLAYPNTVCGVVYQNNQFSWATKHRKHKLPTYYTTLANNVMHHGVAIEHFKATHFHNLAVKPLWRLKRTQRINNHQFYEPLR
jgi:spore germination cell wall hydrolase CwlJ-like protein